METELRETFQMTTSPKNSPIRSAKFSITRNVTEKYCYGCDYKIPYGFPGGNGVLLKVYEESINWIDIKFRLFFDIFTKCEHSVFLDGGVAGTLHNFPKMRKASN